MCTIPTCFKLSLLAVVLATPAIAQQADWPRTFSGQPDFDFNREEVIAERKRMVAEGEDVLATPGNWLDLLKMEWFSPFPKKTETPDEGIDGIAMESAEPNLLLQDATDFGSELPTLEAAADVDLTEFTSFLGTVIDDAVRTSAPRYEELNIPAELEKLKIGTISTSPVKYALINGQKYQVGNSLTLPVWVVAQLADVTYAVDARMPNATQLGEEAYAPYRDIRDKVLKDFAVNLAKRPEAFRTRHYITATVEDIQPRKVLLEVRGKHYALQLPYAF